MTVRMPLRFTLVDGDGNELAAATTLENAKAAARTLLKEGVERVQIEHDQRGWWGTARLDGRGAVVFDTIQGRDGW